MARRKQKPFEDSLGIERQPEGLARLSRLRTPETLVADVTDYAIGTSLDRADSLPLRKQALLMFGLGAAGCAFVWAMKFVAWDWIELFGEESKLWVFVVIAVSSTTAYGALQLVFEKADTAVNEETGGQFGGFVEASQEEGRWKRRLIAVVLGVLHTGVYFWG